VFAFTDYQQKHRNKLPGTAWQSKALFPLSERQPCPLRHCATSEAIITGRSESRSTQTPAGRSTSNIADTRLPGAG
jgi:hypothetical protein